MATGAVTGGAAAFLVSRDETPLVVALRTVAGVLGGCHGGALPDLLEPATSPTHRSLAHSLLALAGGTSAILSTGDEGLRSARSRVAELETELERATDNGQRFLLAVRVALWQLLIGYAVGLVAGYASHLVLDASTSRSLPAVG